MPRIIDGMITLIEAKKTQELEELLNIQLKHEHEVSSFIPDYEFNPNKLSSKKENVLCKAVNIQDLKAVQILLDKKFPVAVEQYVACRTGEEKHGYKRFSSIDLAFIHYCLSERENEVQQKNAREILNLLARSLLSQTLEFREKRSLQLQNTLSLMSLNQTKYDSKIFQNLAADYELFDFVMINVSTINCNENYNHAELVMQAIIALDKAIHFYIDDNVNAVCYEAINKYLSDALFYDAKFVVEFLSEQVARLNKTLSMSLALSEDISKQLNFIKLMFNCALCFFANRRILEPHPLQKYFDELLVELFALNGNLNATLNNNSKEDKFFNDSNIRKLVLDNIQNETLKATISVMDKSGKTTISNNQNSFVANIAKETAKEPETLTPSSADTVTEGSETERQQLTA